MHSLISELPSPPISKTGWPWTLEQAPSDPQPSNTKLPHVSIVTPSYNQGQFLEETIRSVLLQGYPNLEYWIIDGGSTDHSIEIIKKYSPWLTGWISEKDRGQADAINKGWMQCKGDYLGWLNSDDLLTPRSIYHACRYLRQNPGTDYVYGDIEHIDCDGNHLRVETYKDCDFLEMVREAGSISQPGSLISRSILEHIGLLDISLHFQMDFDLWLRVGAVSKLGYLPVPLARYREHLNAKTSRQTNLAAQEIMVVYTKLFEREDLIPVLAPIRRHAWGSAHIYASRAWYYSNHFKKAYQELWRAIVVYPGIVAHSSFYQLLPKLITLSILGGRRSSLYKRLQKLR